MPPCYTGTILHVDLDKSELVFEHPADEFYRKYAGGSAMGMYYLLRESPIHADPLGPENVLTFFTGPLTGLPIPGQSRVCVNARSPLGNAIGDSQAGGFFPAAMKFAGFDGIVVKGKSDHPVYLFLKDGQAELLDASDLWGKETALVDQILENKHGQVEVAQCGLAGENKVRFASIMNGHNRANGRTGMGAVMGSKLLKAVVVQGNEKVHAVDPEVITRKNREGTQNIENIPDIKGMGINGTADLVPFQNAAGTFPAFNYNEGSFEQYMELSGEHMSETILKKRDTCFACTLRCKRVVEAEYRDARIDPTYGGPEYETISTLGSYCGIADLKAVALANQLCSAYGLDTISCGATIAFAMECFEKGVLTIADTGGIELKWGNADAMLEMIRLIARREGFGAILAEGSARAASLIGRGADEFLITVKGNEFPAHMPQAKRTLGLIYAINPFGADHQSSEHDPYFEEGSGDFYLERLSTLGEPIVPQPVYSLTDEKVKYAYLTELFYSATDTYSLCQFIYGPAWSMFGPTEMAEILSSATGWDISIKEILQVGERRLNMMRAYNMREGFSRKDDRLPSKMFKALQGSGPTAGLALNSEEIEHAKELYYQLAGWDAETGNPTPQKLSELGLDWIQY